MRRLLSFVAVGAMTLALTGCGLLDKGVYDAPLPGGADVGANPLTIKATFSDVVDLVPQASVKLDNVAVGRVTKIDLDPGGHSATVDLVVNRAAKLPLGTTARLRQTSLLGEKYVALVPPADGTGQLADGARLGLADTSQTAEVEQVLGALSLVLNGGDIGKFQQISRELQKVSTGRPGEIKGFLNQMRAFVSGLDNRKEAITSAIDGLAALSTTLDGDKDKIAKALDELSPGMEVMVQQRAQFVKMLQALDRLSKVTVSTLDKAQDDIVADFKLLAPILDQLAKSGNNLPKALEIMLTYPFPDSVLGAIKGDYFNVFITTNFRTLPNGCDAIGCFWAQPDSGPETAPSNAGMTARMSSPEMMWPQLTAPSSPPAPSLLPPTSSPAPGVPTPTVSVPSESVRPSSTPAPSDSPSPSSSSSPSPSGEPTADTPSPTAAATTQGSEQ